MERSGTAFRLLAEFLFVCLFFCLLSSPLFVFLSLSILLVILTYVASTDGVDTPSGDLPLYFSLCYDIVAGCPSSRSEFGLCIFRDKITSALE